MKARVVTRDGADGVQHWQLVFGGTLIADTTYPGVKETYDLIAERLNWFDEMVRLTVGKRQGGNEDRQDEEPRASEREGVEQETQRPSQDLESRSPGAQSPQGR